MTPALRDTLTRRIDLAQRWEQTRRARPALWYAPHPGQVAYHQAPHTIRALFPGNGFGKTRAAGTEANWWLTHRHPYQETPKWPIIAIWGCESYKQFEILRAQLEAECFDRGWSFNGSDNVYAFPRAADDSFDKLFLISYDSDWSNVQGINPDLVIFDEEPPHKLWKEMRMRRRGTRKTRYTFAATATKGMTWMHDDVYLPWLKHHADQGMDEEQAITAQAHPLVWCLPRGGIDDNPGADQSDRDWYRSHTYNSEAERRVRLFGGFADFSGTPVFDLEGLERHREHLIDGEHGRLARKEGVKGEPPAFEWIGDGPGERGRITIFEHPAKDAAGRPADAAVIGHDSAYGLLEGDFDYAIVVSRNTGRQLAEAQGRWGNVQWAEVLESLYWYYNEAFLLGERQVGLPTMRRLYDEMGCTYQYFDRDDSTPGRRPSDKLGHHRRTGDLVIPRLRRTLAGRDNRGRLLPCPITIRSRELFRQLGKFQFRPRSSTKEIHEVHDEDLSMGAPSGDHDDGVLSLAYANLALGEVARFPEPVKPKYGPGAAGTLLDHDKVFEPKDEDE